MEKEIYFYVYFSFRGEGELKLSVRALSEKDAEEKGRAKLAEYILDNNRDFTIEKIEENPLLNRKY